MIVTVCRYDGVVGLTSLSNKEMTERSFGSQKSGRNKSEKIKVKGEPELQRTTNGNANNF